jgi:hypothetical protein
MDGRSQAREIEATTAHDFRQSTIIAGGAKLIRKLRWIGLERGVWSWR